MVILIMAIWMLLIFDIVIFFVKLNGSTDRLIGDESVKK